MNLCPRCKIFVWAFAALLPLWLNNPGFYGWERADRKTGRGAPALWKDPQSKEIPGNPLFFCRHIVYNQK